MVRIERDTHVGDRKRQIRKRKEREKKGDPDRSDSEGVRGTNKHKIPSKKERRSKKSAGNQERKGVAVVQQPWGGAVVCGRR